MPSDEVITRLPVPLLATATKRPSPYATDFHSLLAAEVREVHTSKAFAVVTPINEIPEAISKTAVLIEINFLIMM
jgi:hypothetical protein